MIYTIFQDTKIEDIPPIILQANFYLILALALQQKTNQIEDILYNIVSYFGTCSGSSFSLTFVFSELTNVSVPF